MSTISSLMIPWFDFQKGGLLNQSPCVGTREEGNKQNLESAKKMPRMIRSCLVQGPDPVLVLL
jgi:hypothetical protein